MARFDDYCNRKANEYGARFVRPAGTSELVAAFNDQGRYEVDVYGDGTEIKRGRISVTTGWKPAFLLMHNVRSVGSSVLLDARTCVIRKVAP